jgi:hypothetical protein
MVHALLLPIFALRKQVSGSLTALLISFPAANTFDFAPTLNQIGAENIQTNPRLFLCPK